jgi:hypothetical protein
MITRLAPLLFAMGALAQDVPADHALLSRHYHDGETLTYRMKGTNERWQYEIQAAGVVKKDGNGKYTEEYAWSNLTSGGAAMPLSAASLQFRQTLSLDPEKPPAIPDLSKVQPMLIGPITDLLTFYADLWLAARTGKLSHTGDHVYQKLGIPASWADGNYVVLGEDSIDFDITLTNVDGPNQVATLLVKHVPPEQPAVHLPVEWMREPVADTKNNWVDVQKREGKFVAAVGKETFDVRMKVSLADGKILSGTIENPVKAEERDCEDAGFTKCGDARPHEILRRIEIALER